MVVKMTFSSRQVLDAIPLMVFVVDSDVRIRDLNETARNAFGPDATTVLDRRGGEVLHCLHAAESPEGCGTGAVCSDCVIRNSVGQCIKGQKVSRKRSRFTLVQGKSVRYADMLITTSPITSVKEPLALLIIEDVTEMSALQDIVPICMHCKKIRDDHEFWHSVESYFQEHIGVDFSHGICPDCQRKHEHGLV